MEARDRELLFQLIEDVSIITTMVGEGMRPMPFAARAILGPMLRRWLSDGMIHKVQRLLRPTTLEFELRPMNEVVDACQAGKIENWMNYIQFDGVGISSLLPMPEYVGHTFGVGPKVADGTAAQFTQQKMLFLGGSFFTRSQILGLHANKRGGVHLDHRRLPDEGHIDEIAVHFGLEVLQDGNRQMHIGETILEAKFDPTRRPLTYDAYELVAIDTARLFSNGVKNILPSVRSLLE
jgi:hypothetical protein